MLKKYNYFLIGLLAPLLSPWFIAYISALLPDRTLIGELVLLAVGDDGFGLIFFALFTHVSLLIVSISFLKKNKRTSGLRLLYGNITSLIINLILLIEILSFVKSGWSLGM